MLIFPPSFLLQLLLSSWEGGYNLQCQDLTSAGEADVRVSPEKLIDHLQPSLLKKERRLSPSRYEDGAGITEERESSSSNRNAW